MNAPVNRRDVVALPGTARPDRIGQGTAVEQSRASAEVFAAVLAADQRPRDEERAIRRRDSTCARRRTAEGAFYAFPRAGKTVTGPTVQLARDIAACWGNIQYGITELRRDDQFGQSEMQAWAWDLESNTRNALTFIVPHTRHTSDSVSMLTDPRDIYENNANAGARRLRECILDVIPRWFVEGAVDRCHETLRSQADTKPLPERRAEAIRRFEELGVSEGQLVAHRGKPAGQWTETDMAQLTIAYRTIERGERRADDLFPAATDAVPSTDDLTPARPDGAAPRPKGQRPPTADQAAPTMLVEFPHVPGGQVGERAAQGLTTNIGRLIGKAGVSDDAVRKAVASRIAGLTQTVTSTRDLSPAEAKQVVRYLSEWDERGVLREQVAAVAQAAAHQWPALEGKQKPTDLPPVGSQAWHQAGHPRNDLGEIVTTDRELSGDCGICEQPDVGDSAQ